MNKENNELGRTNVSQEMKLEVGLEQLDSCTYSIARDYVNECQLVMMHMGSRAKRIRFYMIEEKDIAKNTETDWVDDLDSDKLFRIEDVELNSDGNLKLQNRIKKMYGRYRDEIVKIMELIWDVEKERKAAIKEVSLEGGGSIKGIWEELKLWLLMNAADPRVVCLVIRGITEIGFIGNMKEVGKIFATFTDIKFSEVKFFLKNKGYLKTDSEDSRYTRKIQKDVALRENLGATSMFNLNFDDDPKFVEEFLKVREEKRKAEKQ